MNMISVVMPIYNVEKYVAKAIQSVLNQTYRHFELIIIDDCSPDKSVDICQGFQDSRIRIIRHQANRGLAGARNTGIRHANGRYIAFIDSDDAWEPDKLRLHCNHLDTSPLVGISFSRSQFIDENNNRLNAYQMPRLDHVSADHYLCRNPIGNGSAPVIRRSVFNDIAFEGDLHGQTETFFFDETFRQSEDIECWIRIRTTTNWRIEGLTQALTLYRLNSGGLSSDIPKQLASWEAVIEKTKQHSPELIKRSGKLARAYQLRYLSRQAVRLKDGKMAVKLANQALSCHPGILFHEPSRTLTTLGAAYILFLAPDSLCTVLEPYAVKTIGTMQKLRMSINAHRVAQN